MLAQGRRTCQDSSGCLGCVLTVNPMNLCLSLALCLSQASATAVWDNYLYFDGADGLTWTEKKHDITGGQAFWDSTAVPAEYGCRVHIGPVHFRCHGPSLEVTASRLKSTPIADEFMANLKYENYMPTAYAMKISPHGLPMLNPPPPHGPEMLNFVLFGDMAFTIKDKTYQCNDMRVGQGHFFPIYNNWWLGSQSCKARNLTTVPKIYGNESMIEQIKKEVPKSPFRRAFDCESCGVTFYNYRFSRFSNHFLVAPLGEDLMAVEMYKKKLLSKLGHPENYISKAGEMLPPGVASAVKYATGMNSLAAEQTDENPSTANAVFMVSFAAAGLAVFMVSYAVKRRSEAQKSMEDAYVVLS
eukprot:gnl/TRDRNA2_/TRDRNA2_80043_c0_seq1.p1 gnl/TRDRNA2_/TRDRNA2_80043_c0~~gnl/TRDRNA2_/TRDRNA2_80043_c0_seq1.p1  ORF type:complete len:357 (-),score=42.52 gnl/TRDRNA2_/TRDRNA2_80043_c0_seq1:293-1363(-)